MHFYDNDVITVVLGGGKGSRLMPLTKGRSKPAVPFGGKYRLIDIPISNSINSGLNFIYVLTQFNSFSLNRHIRASYRFGFFNKGFVDIIAAEQTPGKETWFQGTADAVRKVLHHLDSYNPRQILILSGDQLYNMNLREMVEQHRAKGSKITVATKPVPRSQASALGIMRTDQDGLIHSFVEKPTDPEVLNQYRHQDGLYQASMGIYVFDYPTLRDILNNCDATDFGGEIIPKSLEQMTVHAYLYDGYWEDIGTISAFFKANLMLTDDIPPLNLYDEGTLFLTHPRYLPPAKTGAVSLDRTLIAEGATLVSGKFKRTIVGVRARVDAEADIAETIIMGSDYYSSPRDNGLIPGIGKRARIRNAIVEKNARIGDDVTLLNSQGLVDYEDEHLEIRDGIIIVPRRGRIPDGYTI